MGIAFFDLDKTLLSVNSGWLWLRRELSLGHVSRTQALRASTWLIRYHLGFAKMEVAIGQAISLLAGTGEAELRARTTDFYREQVRRLYRPGALAALDWHKRRGDQRVLLTSSSGYLSELVARELQLDEILCNRFEVDLAGLHTGRSLGALCFGKGKLAHARAYAERIQSPLAEATFYTDSYSDLPVLEAVRRPVAVNPDPRLRRLAFRRKWEIVDWGVASPREALPSVG